MIAQRESGDCQGIRPCCGREGMNGVCQDILFDSLTLMLISLPDEQGQRVWVTVLTGGLAGLIEVTRSRKTSGNR